MGSPEHFDNQLRNKIWYAFFGWKAMMEQDYRAISRKLCVKINDQKVQVPDQSQGVIFINIDSFAGGSRLWRSDVGEAEQAHNDQLFEAVSVDGPLHLGQIKTGISNAQKLGQCKRVELQLLDKMHIQFDGEPEFLPPCSASIVHAGQALMLCNRDRLSHNAYVEVADTQPAADAVDVNGIFASVLKEAQQAGTIDARQARVLKKSFGSHMQLQLQSRRK